MGVLRCHRIAKLGRKGYSGNSCDILNYYNQFIPKNLSKHQFGGSATGRHFRQMQQKPGVGENSRLEIANLANPRIRVRARDSGAGERRGTLCPRALQLLVLTRKLS